MVGVPAALPPGGISFAPTAWEGKIGGSRVRGFGHREAGLKACATYTACCASVAQAFRPAYPVRGTRK